jgi:hypothetical protein
MARTIKADKIAATQAAIAKHLQPHQAAVLDKVAELAKAGDPASVAAFLKYVSPPPSAVERTIHLPELAASPTLHGKLLVILSAIGDGRIAPGVAEQLCRSLSAVGAAAALEQFNERLAALERTSAAQARSGGVLPTATRVDPQLPNDLA